MASIKTPARPTRRELLVMGAASALLPAVALPAEAADEWPSRAVTFVVPFAPGASNDLFARAMGQLLSKTFGQPFVIENRSGAGGYTAADYVSRQKPDGYTILEDPNGVAGLGPFLKLKFDPRTDLTPIAAMARAPSAMVIPASLPVKTVQEFIAYAKQHDGQMLYGYAGDGSPQELDPERFKSLTGLNIKKISYKNSVDATTDLLAGRLQVMFVSVASTLGSIQAGSLRLLAYCNDSYPPGSPPAPTMAEAGVAGMEGQQIWWGVFAPPKLPKEIVTKLNAAVAEGLKDPMMVKLISQNGASPLTLSADDFAALVNTEVEKVEKAAKDL